MRKQKFSLFLLFLVIIHSFFSTQDVGTELGLQTARASTEKTLKEKCRSCRVTLTNRDVFEGSLFDVTGESLALLRRENFARSTFQATLSPEIQTSIPFDSISSIRCGDPYHDGLYKGFFVGGLLTALFFGVMTSAMRSPQYDYDDNDAWKAMGLGFAIGGAFGAAFGITLDAALGSPVKEIELDVLKKEWK
jgi:hypothetical protein